MQKLHWNKLMLQAAGKAVRTSLWLLRIILPISLLVRFLDYFGILLWLATFLDPLFLNMGLPGSSAIVFITSIFLPLYAPLAIITSLPLTLRELTILALMCQISHNLPVESAIQAQTGTSFRAMTLLRISMSIVVGVMLNLILPAEMGMPLFAQTNVTAITSVGALLLLWLKSSLQIALLILIIVFLLNLLYSLLDNYQLIPKLSRGIKPLLAFFGLSKNTAFLWLIGYIVGLAYGGALMMDQMKEGKVTRSEASLLNHHLAISHSVLEDNLLFVALGVSLWWILAVRFAVAFAVVWLRRFWLTLRGHLLFF